MRPEVVAKTNCVVGENPLWNALNEKLYWCDIPAGKIYRFDPSMSEHMIIYEDGVVGGFTIQANGSFLLFKDGGRVDYWEDGKSSTVVSPTDTDVASRFNDVWPDPNGGVFCGTMPTDDASGALYHLSLEGTLSRVVDDVQIPNGIDFSPGVKYLYLTESDANAIWQYAYDPSTGELSERERFVDTSDEAGVPDGLTVDSEGNVWSARWGGHAVVKYAPDGTELDRVEFPVERVSSVAFGGAGASRLYVTTARGLERQADSDLAGALFAVETDSVGKTLLTSDVKPAAR